MPISEKLKQIRNYYKLTQEEFAKKLGISRVNLVNIEKGRTTPTPTLIKFVCLAYDIDINWLTDDSIPQIDNIPKFSKGNTINDIMSYYNKLNPEYQELILNQVKQLLIIQQSKQ